MTRSEEFKEVIKVAFPSLGDPKSRVLRKVLVYMVENPGASFYRISKDLKLHEPSVLKAIRVLEKRGYLRKVREIKSRGPAPRKIYEPTVIAKLAYSILKNNPQKMSEIIINEARRNKELKWLIQFEELFHDKNFSEVLLKILKHVVLRGHSLEKLSQEIFLSYLILDVLFLLSIMHTYYMVHSIIEKRKEDSNAKLAMETLKRGFEALIFLGILDPHIGKLFEIKKKKMYPKMEIYEALIKFIKECGKEKYNMFLRLNMRYSSFYINHLVALQKFILYHMSYLVVLKLEKEEKIAENIRKLNEVTETFLEITKLINNFEEQLAAIQE